MFPNPDTFFSKGDGERAMMEASNELRVVKNELENLMDIISTKVYCRLKPSLNIAKVHSNCTLAILKGGFCIQLSIENIVFHTF